jgi:hypothetical protein
MAFDRAERMKDRQLVAADEIATKLLRAINAAARAISASEQAVGCINSIPLQIRSFSRSVASCRSDQATRQGWSRNAHDQKFIVVMSHRVWYDDPIDPWGALTRSRCKSQCSTLRVICRVDHGEGG